MSPLCNSSESAAHRSTQCVASPRAVIIRKMSYSYTRYLFLWETLCSFNPSGILVLICPQTNARLNRRKLWLWPVNPGTSRGAGSTEQVNTNDLLAGEIHFNILSSEIRSSHYDDELDLRVEGIAKQILISNNKRPPSMSINIIPDNLREDGISLTPQWQINRPIGLKFVQMA